MGAPFVNRSDVVEERLLALGGRDEIAADVALQVGGNRPRVQGVGGDPVSGCPPPRAYSNLVDPLKSRPTGVVRVDPGLRHHIP